MITVHLVPILSDNYSYILTAGEEVAVVDPGDGLALIAAFTQRDLIPQKIFITHHHSDHIAGIEALKNAYGCKVYGPAEESQKIPALDTLLADDDTVSFGEEKAHIIATPGHTLGHIAYWFPQSQILFAGDTLFSLGCGRLFEGTPEQMFTSLVRLKDLPNETRLYCGHEYTESNAAFCLSIDPDNEALQQKLQWIKKQRANHQPTLPALLGEEKSMNVFLTCENAEAFAALRRLKDNF